MRFWTAGRKRQTDTGSTPATPLRYPLTTVRVRTATDRVARSFGRRDVDFVYDRIFIPSLVLDHTELVLRQAGEVGNEGFVMWAGTIAHGNGYVSTLLVPRAYTGPTHGEISAETTANLLLALDDRDLVPLLQLHTHPQRAWLSTTDAIRPVVAVNGFISVVIPDFGFVDLANTELWSAHELVGPGKWRELDAAEKNRRFIVDDSIIRVD
jgi:hypothetical protein